MDGDMVMMSRWHSSVIADRLHSMVLVSCLAIGHRPIRENSKLVIEKCSWRSLHKTGSRWRNWKCPRRDSNSQPSDSKKCLFLWNTYI